MIVGREEGCRIFTADTLYVRFIQRVKWEYTASSNEDRVNRTGWKDEKRESNQGSGYTPCRRLQLGFQRFVFSFLDTDVIVVCFDEEQAVPIKKKRLRLYSI